MQAKVDSYKVKQYEDLRFVDTVTVLEIQGKYALCYSPCIQSGRFNSTERIIFIEGRRAWKELN